MGTWKLYVALCQRIHLVDRHSRLGAKRGVLRAWRHAVQYERALRRQSDLGVALALARLARWAFLGWRARARAWVGKRLATVRAATRHVAR